MSEGILPPPSPSSAVESLLSNPLASSILPTHSGILGSTPHNNHSNASGGNYSGPRGGNGHSGTNKFGRRPRQGEALGHQSGGVLGMGGAPPPARRVRIERTQQCPYTVRVRWATGLAEGGSAQTQALEVLCGLENPDMGLSAWADTQMGDLVGRILNMTRAEGSDATKLRAGLDAYEGKSFSVAVHMATNAIDGSVQSRAIHKSRIDEKGLPIRNPYYYTRLAEVGYATGNLLLVEVVANHGPIHPPAPSHHNASHHSSGGPQRRPPAFHGGNGGGGMGVMPLPPPPQYGSNMGCAIMPLPPIMATPQSQSGPLLPTPAYPHNGLL